jgi:hypothetical protein
MLAVITARPTFDNFVHPRDPPSRDTELLIELELLSWRDFRN